MLCLEPILCHPIRYFRHHIILHLYESSYFTQWFHSFCLRMWQGIKRLPINTWTFLYLSLIFSKLSFPNCMWHLITFTLFSATNYFRLCCLQFSSAYYEAYSASSTTEHMVSASSSVLLLAPLFISCFFTLWRMGKKPKLFPTLPY